jgi:hypothetical protein
MKLSNRDKHNLAVSLLSDYMLKVEFEHLILSSDKEFDIYIPSSETRIKVFCNYSNAKSIKIPNDFEVKSNILYLVIKPTRKNVHGFSCVGGVKSVIENAIKIFDTKGAPKNIQVELLKPLSVSKFVLEKKNILEDKKTCLDGNQTVKSVRPNIKRTCVNKRRSSLNILQIPEVVSSQSHLYL